MHKCEIPFYDSKKSEREGGGAVAMRVFNGFHYGMDELDEFNTPDHNDWHAPGKIEKRIDRLVMPAVEQLGGADKIDLVQLHSGMWDLVSECSGYLLVGFDSSCFQTQKADNLSFVFFSLSLLLRLCLGCRTTSIDSL
jgi:hypothetical protein